MKTNLLLDTDNDLVIGSNHNLQFTPDIQTFTAQKILNYLKTFAGEWFLDYTLGVPFFDRILIKNADLNDVNSIFLAVLNSISEVKKIISFQTSFNSQNRVYSISFVIQAYDDTIVKNNGVIL